MTNYAMTWGVDAPNYNAATKRALDKIEANLALKWNLANNNSRNFPARVLGTTYTNNGTVPRLVCITLTITGGVLVTAPAIAEAKVEFKETTDGAFITFADVKVQDQAVNAASRRQMFAFIANPGCQYKATTVSGNVTIFAWYEVDFSAAHTPQTWTHGEQVASLTKPNNYSGDVNFSAAADTSPTAGAITPGTSVQTAPGTVIFILAHGFGSASIPLALVTTKNSGGTLVNSGGYGGQTGGAAQGATSSNRQVFLLVNGGGGYQFSVTPTAASTVRPTARTAVTFVAAESGVSTGNKWRTLDQNANDAINPSKVWTRSAYSASAKTTLTFVAVRVTLAASAVATATASLRVNGTTVSTVDEPSSTVTINTEATITACIGPGDTWDVTVGGATATIVDRWEWTVAAG